MTPTMTIDRGAPRGSAADLHDRLFSSVTPTSDRLDELAGTVDDLAITPAVAAMPEPDSGALREFGACLDELVSLEPDWDSYGALEPSRLALEAAWSLASTLADVGVDVPQVVPTPDGGVQLEWYSGALSLVLALVPGDASFIFDDGVVDERHGGDLLPDVRLFISDVLRFRKF